MAILTNSDRRNYHTLDGLRGIAAISIVILHTPHFFRGWNLPTSFLAVDLFYLLSGFVLASAYEGRFNSGITVIEFLRIRIIRLYPLYILGMLLGLPVALLAMKFGVHGMSVDWTPALLFTSIPLSILMLPTPAIGNSDLLYPFNGVFWSVFFEIVINFIYVLFFPFLRSDRRIAFFVAISAITLISCSLWTGSLSGGDTWATFLEGFCRVTFSFFFGVIIYRTLGKRDRTQSPLALLMVVLVPVIFLFPRNVIFELLCVIIVFPVLVAISATVEPVSKLERIFKILGISSYAVYALHRPLYRLLLGFMTYLLPVAPERFAPWLGIIYIPLLIVFCVFIDSVYDAPFRRMLTQFVTARSGAAAQVATTPS